MKILAIRGKNLASLDGEFEIDFTREPLVSAGIFAITGFTGSGKSTLLDALCLALFASTPRLNTRSAKSKGASLKDVSDADISQSDPGNLLRKGTSDAYAEVDFIGKDMVQYRSRWSVARARNKVNGKIQSDSLFLKELLTDKTISSKKTEALKEIEERLGLSFEQFTRSVLLAQNDFTAFLRADENDRADLLEKLTGTEIYSNISKLIFEKSKDSSNQLSNISAQLENIKILNEDELHELNNKLNEVNQDLQHHEAEFKTSDISLKWFSDHDEFLKKISEAQIIFDNAFEEEKKSSERKDKLLFLNLIQDARPLVVLTEQKKIEIIKVESELLTSKNNLLNASEFLTECTHKFLSIKEFYQAVLKEETEITPSVNKARELDTTILNISVQLESAQKEYDAIVAKTNQWKSDLLKKQHELKLLSDDSLILSEWLEKNKKVQKISDDYNHFKKSISEAGNLKNEIKQIEKKISFLQERSQVFQKKIPDINHFISEKELLFKEENTKLSLFQLSLEKFNKDEIIKERDLLILKQKNLNLAKDFWKDFSDSERLLNKKQKELADLNEKISSSNSEIEKFNSELIIVNAKLGQAEKSLNIAKLSTAKDTAELRHQLVKDEPCPVCGSMEHPWEHSFEQAKNIFQELENDARKLQKQKDSFFAQKISSETIFKTALSEKEKSENEILMLTQNFQTASLNWENHPLVTTIKSNQISDVESWIKEELKLSESSLNALNSDEKEMNKIISELEDTKKKSDTIREQIVKLNIELSETKNELEKVIFELNNLSDQIKKDDLQLSEKINDLNNIFGSNLWQKKWEQDAEIFIEEIFKIVGTWNDKSKKFLENNELHKSLTSEEQTMAALFAESVKSFDADLLKLNLLKTESEKNIQLRSSLLEGKSVIEFLKLLSLKIKTSKENFDEISDKKNEAEKSLKEMESILKERQFRYENLISELNNSMIQLSNWIVLFNEKNNTIIDEEYLKKALQFDHSWLQNEARELQLIADKITSSKATLDERKLQLDEHNKSCPQGIIKEEVLLKLNELQLKIGELRNLQVQFKTQVAVDAENKLKAGSLLKVLGETQTIAENWGKLNELIGSSDGKKFKKIAQSFTLDVLLGYANIHLKELARRYRLERIPDSLSLMVVDQDMGDEVRSVHSLSGGESFLASLALALGLASLSSRRIQVESLFIDEGFGSLDPETLKVAMDALEHLQSQGRKVGVISHVQEMKERIPAQIHVRKLAGGKSKVEVLGLI